MKQGPVFDAPSGNWVDTYAPAASRPYLRMMRADRPIGWWLLLIPCWWGAALAGIMAGQGFVNLWHVLLFFIGAVVMRGAGCVWNDVTDRDIDAEVERTRSRPIPSGQVSVRAALVFMVGLSLIGLLVLVQFNWATILWAIASLGIVAIYPFMKRVTWWPQIVLGFAFNWGALLGFTAIFGVPTMAGLLLYLAGIAWTLGYDTVYALQDIEDDAVVGVKSTARLFGADSQRYIAGFYALAVVLAAAASMLAGAGLLTFAGLFGFAVMLALQTRSLDINDPQSALQAFRANRNAGLVFFLGLILDAPLQAVLNG
jgi:4-hydroxybenzoate polyprenyltransferase